VYDLVRNAGGIEEICERVALRLNGPAFKSSLSPREPVWIGAISEVDGL